MPQQTRSMPILSPRWREALTGYAFVLPAMVLFGLFGLFPIAYSVYMSLFDWRVIKSGFVGLDQYRELVGSFPALGLFVAGAAALLLAQWVWVDTKFVARAGRYARPVLVVALAIAGLMLIGGWQWMVHASQDPQFLHSLVLTLYYALGTVPTEVALGLLIAWLLYQKIRMRAFFRLVIFLPYVLPLVATAVVFRVVFSPGADSPANRLLAAFGAPPQGWLFSAEPITHLLGLPFAGPSLALVTAMLFGIWTFVGFNVVVFLAGLTDIPTELLESAELDGAGRVQRFFDIVLPLLSPVIFYLLMVAMIGTLMAFTHIYVMRTPSALGTLDVASVRIFQTFYESNDYGKAAAESVLLFSLIVMMTIFQFRLQGRWVFYG